MERIITHNYNETVAFAEEFAKTLKKGTVIAYLGDLGAGKTAFTSGLVKGLGIKCDVSSPTFAICNEYHSDGKTLYHFDMYRVDGWDDLYSTAFFDYLETDAYIAVEWSENIEGLADNLESTGPHGLGRLYNALINLSQAGFHHPGHQRKCGNDHRRDGGGSAHLCSNNHLGKRQGNDHQNQKRNAAQQVDDAVENGHEPLGQGVNAVLFAGDQQHAQRQAYHIGKQHLQCQGIQGLPQGKAIFAGDNLHLGGNLRRIGKQIKHVPDPPLR